MPTPNLDRLAAGGTRFNRVYVAQASCSSSRSAFLTGLNPHQNGQIGLVNRGFSMSRDWPTLPGLVGGEGRRTGLFDKLHVAPRSACADRLDVWENKPGTPFTRDHEAVSQRTRGYLEECGERTFFLQWDLLDPHEPYLTQVAGLPADPLPAGSMHPWSGSVLKVQQKGGSW